MLNGQSGNIEECIVIDEEDTYLRSKHVYVENNLYIGNKLYMTQPNISLPKERDKNRGKQTFLPVLAMYSEIDCDDDCDLGSEMKKYENTSGNTGVDNNNNNTNGLTRKRKRESETSKTPSRKTMNTLNFGKYKNF